MKRTTIRIPEEDFKKMLEIKTRKGLPINLQLMEAWREKNEHE